MSRAGGLLKGTVIRKSGLQSTQQSRSATPQIASSSTTTSITANIPLGGGVKDATGKTAEYSVRYIPLRFRLLLRPFSFAEVYGRPMSGVQVRQISKSQITPACQCLLSQNVCYFMSTRKQRHTQLYLRCESCIDRLFTLGPAPCPICNKTLRKLAFMPQTFEDLGVEKEVAVRRRLAKE